MRGLTTYYHRVETSPAERAMLHVDGDRRGPVVNSAVVSDAAPTYCPTGALVASTVLGADDDSRGLDRPRAAAISAVRHLRHGTGSWSPAIRFRSALPAMLAPLDFRQPVELGDGLFVCGDHRDTASIQGAIVSGRRAAAAVVRR